MYWDGNDAHLHTAWYTDSVLNSLIELEYQHFLLQDPEKYGRTVYRPEANYWLTTLVNKDTVAEELQAYDEMIINAKNGKAPVQLGWPMPFLDHQCDYLWVALNPTSSHWVALEIEVADPPVFRIYNSLLTRAGEKRAQVVCKKMMKILEIESLRPNSPLHAKAWYTVEAEVVPCAQQGSLNIDCGAFATYFIIQRMRKEDIYGPEKLLTERWLSRLWIPSFLTLQKGSPLGTGLPAKFKTWKPYSGRSGGFREQHGRDKYPACS